ncbi:unnamed protein product [Linum tenue]|uniref:Uncharacterized protein n=1 Tax=Linum tenue TaxID=586396 RepID=A0AAV0S3I9_9ROSI|nr:unnamed protein product [Linum tenue]
MKLLAGDSSTFLVYSALLVLTATEEGQISVHFRSTAARSETLVPFPFEGGSQFHLLRSAMPSLFRGLVERRKRTGPKKNGDDENLALVKAAAWAWYQHGSGSSQGKQAVAEFDFAAKPKPAAADMPSRYRVGAMAAAKTPVTATENEQASSLSSSPAIRTGHYSLLDSHEIQSISRQLGSHMAESSRYLDRQETSDKAEEEKKRPADSRRLRQRQVIMCRAGQDVEESALVSMANRYPSSSAKGQVPVVGMEACRPRRRGRRGN